MPYATVEDLESGWKTLNDLEAARAAVLIERTGLFIDSAVERYGIDAAVKADALKVVCCDYVRSLMSTDGTAPVSSVTHQAGSFSETTSYRNMQRNFRGFLSDYLDLLGISGSAHMVKVAIHDGTGEQIAW